MIRHPFVRRGPRRNDSSLARLHIWQIQAVRDVLFVAAILALVWAGYAMRSVTVPLLVALLLAYLFEPLVSYLTERFSAARSLIVSGLLVSVGTGLLVLLAIAIPLIIGQTVQFVQEVRAGRFQESILRIGEVIPDEYQAQFEQAVRWLMPTAERVDGGVPAQPREAVNDEAVAAHPIEPPVLTDEERLRQIVREEIAAHTEPAGPGGVRTAGSIAELIRAGGQAIFGLIGTVVQLGLLAFLIPFYFFFFSVWFPEVTRFGRDLIPVENRPRAMELIRKMDRAVAGFVRGRIVICFIMGVMFAIGWLIVGVPYSIVLGMVVGVFCLVPYLGAVGVPLAIGLLAFDQMHLPEEVRMSWWGIILWPTVVFSVVQVIESYLLTPIIAGKATNLDPVTILVAVLGGGSIGGVYGMILAIPVAACLKILFTDVLLPKVRSWTRGESADPLPIGKR